MPRPTKSDKQTLAKLAAITTPFSAEAILDLYSVAEPKRATQLLASHEALRNQLHRERAATDAMLVKLEECIAELEEIFQGDYNTPAVMVRLRAILEGKA